VTCIFLNKTPALRADPYIRTFLAQYPTPEALTGADVEAIKDVYFSRLGLPDRAERLVAMAGQLLHDPPRIDRPRQKTYPGACRSEVGHLVGVGPYASDAWILFCKKSFYAGHGRTVMEPWRYLLPKDKDLRRYAQRKRREESERLRLLADEVTALMNLVDLFDLPETTPSADRPTPLPRRSGILLGSGTYALRVPQRLIDQASVSSRYMSSTPRRGAIGVT